MATGFKSGGRRKGTPNKVTVEKIELREQLKERVREQFDPMLNALFNAALGHYRTVKTKNGEQRVYTVSPDEHAIEYLLDQTLGRPPQTMQLGGEVRGGVVILPPENPLPHKSV